MSNLYLYVLPIILYTYYIASNTMSAFSIEDPYIQIMKPGDVLYHGNLDREYNIHKSDRIKWFSEDIRNVLQYGYPKKYTVKVPITLIRIDNIPEDYFDDGITQNTRFRDIYNKFFGRLDGNKCRNSVHDNDAAMTNFLIEKEYDGYIMNEMLNCNSFDGGMFHSELAFKVRNRLDGGVNAIDEIPKNNGKPYEFYFDGKKYTADEPGMDIFADDRKRKQREERNNPPKKHKRSLSNCGPNPKIGPLFGDSDSDTETGGSNVKRTKKRRKKTKKQNKKTKRKKNKSKRKRIKK